MSFLAGISAFNVGRHTVGLSALVDDDDESRLVALRIYVDRELVATVAGDWSNGKDAAMPIEALA